MEWSRSDLLNTLTSDNPTLSDPLYRVQGPSPKDLQGLSSVYPWHTQGPPRHKRCLPPDKGTPHEGTPRLNLYPGSRIF